AVLAIEDSGDFNPYYHSVQDVRAYCNEDYATACARAVVGTLARLAGVGGSEPIVETLTLETSSDQLVPGDLFSLQVALKADIRKKLDFYLIMESLYGVSTLYPGGDTRDGIEKVYASAPYAVAPVTVSIWNALPVSAGIAGEFIFTAVATQAGRIPPVSGTAEITSHTPYVLAYARRVVTVR
ncbi:MAG: hypothetical protein NT045_00560, partial [Candidatus Aureabacteria bacterium]|nr:hypothetical protein [Candidatus Auribacterota bacterium]